MRSSAAGLCPTTSGAAGIVIDYIGAYDRADRDYVRARAGLGDLPQIISVQNDSPAQASGIKAGDAIMAVEGTPVKELLAASGDPALLADDIQDRIAAFPAGRRITLTIRRGTRELPARITLTRLCGARFILKTGDAIEAYSDGDNVAISTAAVRFAANNDELALVTGHELAHVIEDKGLPAGLFGRRRMEDRADLLGARLAHCAGYDVKRSLAFWQRFAKKDWLGWLRSPTHRSAGARYEMLSEAIADLSCTKGP